MAITHWPDVQVATGSSSRISVEEFRGDPLAAERIIGIMEAVGWGKYYGTPQDFSASYLAEVARGGRRIYVAKLGPVIVAYAEVIGRPSESWGVAEGEAYLLALAVLPKHVRTGLGKSLAQQILAKLQAVGFKSVIADVRWSNEASIRLTESIGAKLVGPSPKIVQDNGGGEPHLRFSYAFAA